VGDYSFSGKLGKDPELKFKPDGGEYCKFSVAEDTHKKNDPKNKTIWWNCVTWNADLAVEIHAKYSKGDTISIGSSKLDPTEYNGNKSFNVVVWSLGKKAKGGGSSEQPPEPDREYESEFQNDDDVPF